MKYATLLVKVDQYLLWVQDVRQFVRERTHARHPVITGCPACVRSGLVIPFCAGVGWGMNDTLFINDFEYACASVYTRTCILKIICLNVESIISCNLRGIIWVRMIGKAHELSCQTLIRATELLPLMFKLNLLVHNANELRNTAP